MPIVFARGLSKYIRWKCIFSNLSFTVEKGSTVLVVGPNGSGKTTLLTLLALLSRPTSGVLRVFNVDAGSVSRSEAASVRAKRIGYSLQVPVFFENLSLLDNVVLAGVLGGLSPREAKSRAEELLGLVGLGHKKDGKAGRLSGGERKRADIVRALLKDPELLLLDEPFSMLDPEGVDAVKLMLRDYIERGGTLVVAAPCEIDLFKWDLTIELRGCSPD